MAIDALSYQIIIKELASVLCGGKINKIVQPERDEIVMNIYTSQGTKKLVIAANPNVCRMHLTESASAAPQNAPSFCMLLRKHLSNATIEKITTIPFERVADIEICGTNELGYPYIRHLIAELTGKTSNIVLTDESYRILDTIKKVSLDTEKTRQFFPGTQYSFFEPQDKIAPTNIIAIIKLLQTSENPFVALENSLLGCGKDTVNEILYGIDRTSSMNDALNAEIVQRISDYMKSLENPRPNVLISKTGELVDVVPTIYRSKHGNPKFFDTLNEAFDYYFTQKDAFQRFREKSKHISTVIKNAKSRTEKKIAAQTEALLSAEDSTKLNNYGNLILSNIWRINKGMKSAEVEDFYTDNSTVSIPLDENKTPQQNAEAYFKKAAKLKKTAEYTKELLDENKRTAEYLVSLTEALKYSSSHTDLEEIYRELLAFGLIRGNQRGDNLKNTATKKSSVNAIPKPLKYNIEGFTVYAGKNNTQNDYVTHKLAKANDIWLHTRDIHSSHVVISNPENKPVPDSVMQAAAEITAFYSESRNSGKTPVDYTKKAFVKKPSKAALGFVNYTDYTTVIVYPNEHREFLEAK